MMDFLPEQPKKGRGAASNRAGRYEPLSGGRIDDGWDFGADDARSLKTQVTVEHPKTVISWNRSPDLPFDRSINPYRGCEHGCAYCYARPAHAYVGLSPGLDFETKLFAKPAAPEVLAGELRKRSYRPATIMLGSNTDPYQPIERELRITRGLLKVLSDFNHPVAITTKSANVVRDLDLLAPMAEKGLVAVAMSITTLDPLLARTLEPRASAPFRRLDAVSRLRAAGVPVSVMAAPMIPGLNDHELERILVAAREAGAGGAAYVLLRLPMELTDLFREWLETHVPDRAARVLSLVRQCRSGALNQAAFGRRFRGEGPVAALLAERFRLSIRKQGLFNLYECRRPLRNDLFLPPPAPGDQFNLF